ncbi:hypothetical protein KL86DYS2_10996 [uncultured Dysgonomonas sp.]|uniref:Uncharacterized protein n=1 Tax=uncultured Dysgonomonas sp. TaxID=206096 RepID=A0A212J901_9BACT|nr:hypothetical protein KL86DYS2_10996 [uncultured Dysgonomonas sp.]
MAYLTQVIQLLTETYYVCFLSTILISDYKYLFVSINKDCDAT